MRVKSLFLLRRSCCAALICSFAAAPLAADSGPKPLLIPPVGEATLRLISPTVLEVGLTTSKQPPPARVTQWDFVTGDYQLRLPDVSEIPVTVDGQPVVIDTLGFRRRPIYAPFKKRDLRIGNFLYLHLSTPVNEGQTVEFNPPAVKLWPTNAPRKVVADPRRWSPAIHVSQAGYLPNYAKVAMIGYTLGSLGELAVPAESGFQVIESASGQVVYYGGLTVRKDVGYTYAPLPYQAVLQADFSEFSSPGEYQLLVPGLGVSDRFRIDDGAAAAFARTYALGLYHQRCGTANELPFTRHTHAPCHLALAEVPTSAFLAVNKELAEFSHDFANNPRHTAPQLKDVASSLYPFVHLTKVDVSGGHHDAGDYSKYTINVAQTVHALVFAADALAGVAGLDNLGLPESGDGQSDVLQEAKWESDFLAKLQDDDGGFYFLVYPRNRAYEDNVLPDRGDSQVVFPKTTSATAAAVAALAQTASSPLFKRMYPEAAASYLAKALKGWEFLQKAFAQYGRDGSYQKISHYGDEFMHDDEIAWAAAELFAATGDPVYQSELIAHFDPSDRNTRRFTWWRMFEGYGCAIRSYAFAARTGRLRPDQLSPDYLAKCEAEIRVAADDQARFARENAYGSSFPDPDKAFRTAGWFFSVEHTFDIAVACQLDAKQEYLDAVVGNMNFEGGCNPVGVSFLTGMGRKRQMEIVHQYAQNDRRALPPSGIPLGNLQTGFPSDLPLYPGELYPLTFPPDRGEAMAYPPYDVWADTYNNTTEAVTAQQARSLASMAWLMARTPLASQPWRPAQAQIVGLFETMPLGLSNTAHLAAENMDLAAAEVVWEGRNQLAFLGPNFTIAPIFLGPHWVEAEAMLPDGRRIFAVGSFDAVAAHPVTALEGSRVQIAGTAGQNFVLQRSSNLRDWVSLMTNTFSTATFELTDLTAPDTGTRFYRAIAAP